jgi:hypothetical protein
MSYEFPGDAVKTTNTTNARKQYSNSADTGRERLTGYVSVTSSSGYRPVQAKRATPKATGAAPSLAPYSQQAQYDALRRELVIAANQSMLMLRLSEKSDLVGLANAGFALRDSLAQLWDLRRLREDDWGDLINLLQTALALEEFEKFSIHQCQAIHSIIVDHLGSGVTDIDDLEAVVSLLRRAGFDPFKAISATDEFDISQSLKNDE